jgi:hypothetical protein
MIRLILAMAGRPLLSGVDETGRTIIELRQQGYTTADGAEETGWDIRRVRRFWKDLLDSMDESGG